MKKYRKRSSALRRDKRLLLRRGITKYKEQVYADNLGHEYRYLWLAKFASFLNVITGCFRNGFPIVVKRLWYSAWAFYPFFFVRSDVPDSRAIETLNHERIHIRQQRDVHIIFSIPLLIVAILAELFGWFNPVYLWLTIPFVPTIFYGLEFIRVALTLHKTYEGKITAHVIRENTCYEREAISRETNAEYLYNRKFLAVLAYTGWKMFLNYGKK